jgi:hypothetical protein
MLGFVKKHRGNRGLPGPRMSFAAPLGHHVKSAIKHSRECPIPRCRSRGAWGTCLPGGPFYLLARPLQRNGQTATFSPLAPLPGVSKRSFSAPKIFAVSFRCSACNDPLPSHARSALDELLAPAQFARATMEILGGLQPPFSG